MCFCKPSNDSNESNYIQIGTLKVMLLANLGLRYEAIVIFANGKLVSGYDEIEGGLGMAQHKQAYLKDPNNGKLGTIAKFPAVNQQTLRMVVYVILPEDNISLKDFYVHKGIVAALEGALQSQGCARVGILSPKLSLFGMTEEFYIQKLTSAMKVVGLKKIPGVVSAEVKPAFYDQMKEKLGKNQYEEGQCDEW